ncbi:MAG: sulfotransferase [Gammaproteobacteria bacterium]|nr:sulfotransferase [Gammaproteobacteria bacterium]
MIDYRLTQLATDALRRRHWPLLAQLATQLIAADSSAADPYFLLGLAHWQQGNLRAALQPLQQAVKLAPTRLEYLAQWARYLLDVGDMAAALRVATAAGSLNSRNPLDWDTLGNVATRLEQHPLARQCFAQACKLDGKQPRWWNHLGAACNFLGDRKAAADAYRKALSLAPGDGFHHWALAHLERYRSGDPHLETLRTLWGDPRLDNRHRGLVGIALAKALDDIDAINDSFAVLSEARALLAPFHPYDAPRIALACQQLAHGYSVHPVTAATQGSPLFIVGLPRSGSTLLEQLLAAHPQITAGGELGALPRTLQELAGVRSRDGLEPELLQRLPALSGSAVRQRYDQLRSHLPRSDRYLTDKLPFNGLYAGAILAHWPDARIIHIRRAPVAACWANFRRYLTFPIAVGHSLDSAAHFYQHHDALLGYYQQRSPQRVTTIAYEQLAAAPEQTLAQLHQWLGLAPHEGISTTSPRGIATASAAQVREGVHQRAIDEWQRYRRYLEGLVRMFG